MFARFLISLIFLLPVVVYATPSQNKLSQVPPEYRGWINDSCPYSLGPQTWNYCVDENVDAINNNFPDKKLEEVETRQRDWVKKTCPRSLGPSTWAYCVNENLDAFEDGFPEGALTTLDQASQSWIEDSCPRSLGPSSWSYCVNENLEAFEDDFPESKLASLDEDSRAWIEDSCPRSLGPSTWAYCVKQDIESLRENTSHRQSVPEESTLASVMTKPKPVEEPRATWEVNTNNVALLPIDYNLFSGSGTSLVAWPDSNGEVIVGYSTLWFDSSAFKCDESKESIHRINEQPVRFITEKIGEAQCTEIPLSEAGRKFVAEAFFKGQYVQWNKEKLSARGFTSAIQKVYEGYNAL